MNVPSDITTQLGYDPSRLWQAGQSPASLTMLGDVADAFHLEAFNLQDISGLTGTALKNLNLSDLGLSHWQTPASLVEAIPQLGNLSLSQVQPLQDLANRLGENYGNATLSDILQQNTDFSVASLGQLDLKQYSLDSIPGLASTPLGQLQGWQQSFIDAVPGLSQVPFASFPVSLLPGKLKFALTDLPWSSAEQGNSQTPSNLFISGSVNKQDQTVPVPCDAGKPCSYIELGDPLGSSGPMYGKRWVSGKVQKVKGGFGPLAHINNGWEPTGMLVYGSAFKVVMTNVNESQGTADFALYLRACAHIPFYGKTCSPYFIGGIPWFPTSEGGLLVVGSDTTPKVNVPSKYQAQIDRIQQQYEPQTNSIGGALDNCLSGSVSGDAVDQAIAAVPDDMRSAGQQSVPRILAAAKQYGVTDPAQVAYILSTVQTETSMGSDMVEGATRYASDPNGYYGRGYVQLTGIDNYRKASQLVGVDLVNDPEKATDPQIAAKILVVGMRDGMFTGQKLSDYVGNGKADFVGARQIVNDSDKSSAIAENAQRYLAAVQGTSIANLKTTGSACATAVASGPVQQRIYQTAENDYGMDTSAGPDGGNEACAWTVNKVLNQSGIPTLGGNCSNSVACVEEDLQSGRGQQITDRSQALAGDIALIPGKHIGICENTGCTQILSNASGARAFVWRSDQYMAPSYSQLTKVYRVVK